MRRTLPTILIVVVGLLLLADFVIINPSLAAASGVLVEYLVLLSAAVAVAGGLSLVARHAGDLLHRPVVLAHDGHDDLVECDLLMTLVGRDVQLVRLAEAERSPLLMADALAQGRVLIDRDRTWPRLKSAERRWQRKATAEDVSLADAMPDLGLS